MIDLLHQSGNCHSDSGDCTCESCNPPLTLQSMGRGLREDPRGPTKHPPGTKAKLAVMIERQSRGWNLFHPHDAGMEWLLRRYIGN